MATASVLYVGDDLCHRIPVMESTGMVVLQADCSIDGVRTAFAKRSRFSAVTFHNDHFPPAGVVISTARELCKAPLILFRSAAVECDERVFDLVIPVPTPPAVWAKSLAQAIGDARRIHETRSNFVRTAPMSATGHESFARCQCAIG